MHKDSKIDMKKLIMTAILLFIFQPMSALAVAVDNLYRIDVPVTSQSDDERAQAAKQAFAQLLMKLTGDTDIEKNPDIQDAMKRADYYVQEFSYSSPTTTSATYFIHISFDANDVKRLLKKAGISFWGEKRPLILVWLAVTNAQHAPEIIGNETPEDALESMKHASKQFGLPLIFPLMDVADMSQVSPQDVSAMTLPALMQAGKRYSPAAYLIGNIVAKEDGTYQSQWQLILKNNHWTWIISNKSKDEIIIKVLSQTSQVLSKYFESDV